MASDSKAVVIDVGSGFIKAGFAGDNAPTAVFPTMVAQDDKGTYFVGDEAKGVDRLLNIRFPVKKGSVTNWDDLEKLLQYTFTQLNTKPNDCTVLFAMSFCTSQDDKTKLAQLMFNKFRVARMFIAINNVLSLYSVGRKTGVVMEIGSGASDCVPIQDGYAIPTAVVSTNVASKLFGETEIKAIAHAIHTSIENVKLSCTAIAELYGNIWLSGGRSSHPGLCNQVRYELQKLTDQKVYVKATSCGGNSSWIGGSILASLDQFQEMYLTEADFRETKSASKLNIPTQKKTVVIDIGSASLKTGFAGDHAPSLCIPTLVAEDEKGNTFVGKETEGKEGSMKLRYPVRNGRITNWTDMENLLQHAISELGIDSSKHKVMFGLSASTSVEDKEKLAEIVFNKFKCPATFMAINNVLSLYATGNLTGVVMEVGAGAADCVAVNGGYAVPRSTVSSDVAGKRITETETNAIAKTIFNCIENIKAEVGPDVTRKLHGNVLLSGGNTASPNLDTRVKEYLEKLATGHSVSVKITPSGGYSAWIGGSILAAMGQMTDLYVYISQYQKDANIIKTKFS